jgi:hypothetical protein
MQGSSCSEYVINKQDMPAIFQYIICLKCAFDIPAFALDIKPGLGSGVSRTLEYIRP